MGRRKMIGWTSKRGGKGTQNTGGHEIKRQRKYISRMRELL
jgi:hypothetical protein